MAELMTLTEVAARLRVSTKTVRRIPELRRIRVSPRRVAISAADVNSYIARRSLAA